MFMIMGPILALYQAQQDPQPRERDYFYVGAFFVFSIWIAIGLIGIVDLIREKLDRRPRRRRLHSSCVSSASLMFAIPVNMLRVGWESHNRTGNYVAWDYSYNILQTLEKNAIIFTNGDNDTFPLWYLQDVEGVRRDVQDREPEPGQHSLVHPADEGQALLSGSRGGADQPYRRPDRTDLAHGVGARAP